jgi:hypothetical protein
LQSSGTAERSGVAATIAFEFGILNPDPMQQFMLHLFEIEMKVFGGLVSFFSVFLQRLFHNPLEFRGQVLAKTMQRLGLGSRIQ